MKILLTLLLFLTTMGCEGFPLEPHGNQYFGEHFGGSIQVTEKAVTDTSFEVSGYIVSEYSNPIEPPWFFEWELWESDSLYQHWLYYGDIEELPPYGWGSLGKWYKEYDYPIETDTTFWSITMKFSELQESDYPNFTVEKLRAYYKY